MLFDFDFADFFNDMNLDDWENVCNDVINIFYSDLLP